MRCALLLLGSMYSLGCSVVCGEEEINCKGQCVFEGQLGGQPIHCGTGDSCVQCPDQHLPHASPACVGKTAETPQGIGICGITCYRNYGDCNHDPTDGCETPLDSDPQNCGACGVVCQGTCTPAGCVETLAEGEEQPTGLVGDFGRAYWASRSGGQIRVRTNADPTATPQTLASMSSADGVPATLALQNGDLILSTGAWQVPDGGTGALVRLPLDGGMPSTILEGLDGPTRVFVAGPAIYWTESNAGLIRRATPGGALGEVLATGRDQPREVAVDAGTVYWLEGGNDGGASSVFMLAPDGGVPMVLSLPADSPSHLVLDYQGVYWSDDARGRFLGRRWQDFALDSFQYGGSGPWRVTSVVNAYGVLAFWTDSAQHAIRTETYPPCNMVSGEANPDWVATGLNLSMEGPAYRGFHLFWVEGSRIRRLTTTDTHPGGQWCQ